MNWFGAWRRFPTRDLLAGVVACVIVLQGFASVASLALAGSARDTAKEITAATTVVGYCHALHGHSQKNPLQGRGDHSQCCVLCSANGRDVVFDAALPGVVAAPEPAISIAGFVKIDFDDHPLGWTSSWSSRAPPRLS